MWSREHSECVKCSGTSRPHMAKGLCRLCYLRKYRKKPGKSEHIKKLKHKNYIRKGGAAEARRKREERHFENNRDDVLQRDDYECQHCGAEDDLVVHHCDRVGRGHHPSRVDNDLSNLITLCRSCHAVEHNTLKDRWSIHYTECRRCGTTKTAHNAKGYCRKCYTLIYYSRKKR